MQVTRFNEAAPYSAPLHHNMLGLRLQGAEATRTEHFWVGYSQFLPGGGAHDDATAAEKVYVVLSGEITVTTPDKSVTLGPLDSCHISANELRRIENPTNHTATMLVIMPNPKES